MDNEPKIYTTPEDQVKQRTWYKGWRIIYPILGLVLVVELILGAKTLFTPLPKSSVQKLQPISDARIVLVSSKDNYKVGDNIPVRVRVVTSGNNTNGTDLILHFDPKVLEATPAAFTRGKIYNDYPLINIDSKVGVIRVSGIASSAKQVFNGVGELGVINFKAKGVGQTILTIDFKPGLTNDSNVISSDDSRDILGSVYNLKLNIK